MTVGLAAARRRAPSLSWLALGSCWVLLVVVPLVLTAIYSFLEPSGIGVRWHFSTSAWQGLLQFGRGETIVRTLEIGILTTSIEFILAFPIAYWLAKRVKRRVVIVSVVVLLTVPFFLSLDSRTVVWTATYSTHGLVNSALTWLGITHHPITSLLYSKLAIYLGLIPLYFSEMFFPLWLAMTFIDDEYIDAVRDLGGSYVDELRDVVLPMAAPGIAAGFVFTLIPILGDTVVSSLLGGGQVVLMSDTIMQLVNAFQYPLTAAFAMALTGAVVVLMALLLRLAGTRARGLGIER
jgi:ABC-type spermidine/putrescine transport system permease subunit I